MNPSRLRILAVGKVRRGWIQDGIDLYRKRLPGLSIVELRDSTPEKESEAIRAARRPDERLVVLMEQGASTGQFSLTLSRSGSLPCGKLFFAVLMQLPYFD